MHSILYLFFSTTLKQTNEQKSKKSDPSKKDLLIRILHEINTLLKLVFSYLKHTFSLLLKFFQLLFVSIMKLKFQLWPQQKTNNLRYSYNNAFISVYRNKEDLATLLDITVRCRFNSDKVNYRWMSTTFM